MASLNDILGKKPTDGLNSLLSNRGAVSSDPTPAEQVAQVEASNARNRQIISMLGEPDPTAKAKTTALDKIFGILDVPGVAVRSLVHNAVNPATDKDVSVLGEIGKSVRGEDRLAGAHILSDFGIKNKWAKLLGGFALDVLLDPMTYLTGGYSNITKAESVAQLAKIADEGLDVARAADYGLDAAKLADRVDDTGRVAAAALTTDEVRSVAKAVRASVGAARGDAGGLKFLGMTVVPDQAAREGATYALKDFARAKIPGADWFERAFINGDYTDIAKMGNEVFDAGFRVKRKEGINALRLAKQAGEDFKKRIEELVPDQTTRDLITYGIGRQFGDLAENGALRDASQTLSEARSALKNAPNSQEAKAALEAAQTAFQSEASQLVFDPEALSNVLRKAGYTEGDISTANEALGAIQSEFDNLVTKRGEAGLDNWTLFGGATKPTTVERTVSVDSLVPSKPAAPTPIEDIPGGTFYHGSPMGEIRVPDPYATKPTTPEGLGTYLTDNPSIAAEYGAGRTAGKRARSGAVSSFTVKPGTKVFDQDAPLGALASEFDTMLDGIAGIRIPIGITPEDTFMSAYKKILSVAKDEGLSPYDVSSVVMDELEMAGYGVMTHLEGKIRGIPHRAVQVINPDAVIGHGVADPSKVVSELAKQTTSRTVQETVPAATDILSAGYMPGMTGEVRQTTLDKLGLNLNAGALVDPQANNPKTVADFIEKLPGANPSAYKSKKYITAEQRMVEGGLLTEMDAARLAGAKVAKDYADIALKDWQDALARMTGGELTPELQAFTRKTRDAFTNDDATRGFLKAYDTMLNWWKKGATIYNFPRFPVRNSLSNQWLLWSENLWDAGANKQAIDILGKVATKQTLTEAEQGILEAATKQGVLQRAADLMQLIGEGKTKIPVLKQYEGIASGANELIENQSRLAGFIAARGKGISDEAAGMMVDKALYDYSGGALTEFETNFMKRLVPFYTWMKQNTKHLVELTAKSPGKITSTTHLVQNARAATPVDTSVMPDWMRESMAIPLPFKQKGETQMITLKGLLPVGDLENLTPATPKSLEGVPEPFKTVLGLGTNALSNMSPIIKTPLEIVMNRDLYYGDQVQEFAGQTRRAPTYVEQFDDLVAKVPGVRDLWSGVKQAFNVGEKTDPDTGEPYLVMDARAAKAMKDLLPWFNYVGRTIDRTPESELSRWGRTLGVPVRSYETDKFARQKAYDDQAALQDLLRGLQSQGRGDQVEAARAAVPSARSAKKKMSINDILGVK